LLELAAHSSYKRRDKLSISGRGQQNKIWSYVQAVVGILLQNIADAMKSAWTYSIVLDASNHLLLLYGSQWLVQELDGILGSLATVFTGTAVVESNFSVLKYEKNSFRTSLLDLTWKA